MTNRHGQPVIAVDGTSASGKSTLSAELARIYGAQRLEYSLFFRLIALHMLEQGFDPAAAQPPTPAQAQEAARYAQALSWDDIHRLRHDARLHSIEVSRTAPFFSGLPEVLASTDAALVTLIEASRHKPVIAEGRTIGKYVYPASDIKLYVDAELAVRAGRRGAALRAQGKAVEDGSVAADLAARDHQDQTRPYQPTGLDAAVHARLDTSHQAIHETLEAAMQQCEQACPALASYRQQAHRAK